MLSKAALCAYLDISNDSVDRLRAEAGFPPPLDLPFRHNGRGGNPHWSRLAVDAWLSSRMPGNGDPLIARLAAIDGGRP